MDRTLTKKIRICKFIKFNKYFSRSYIHHLKIKQILVRYHMPIPAYIQERKKEVQEEEHLENSFSVIDSITTSDAISHASLILDAIVTICS